MLGTKGGLRQRTLAGDILGGTFQKTPSRHITEILALSGLDFAVVDAEHAPFGIEAIDDILAAAKGFPVLVRIPALGSPLLGQSLDAGATGIVVPHVVDRESAAAAVAAARFHGGKRGLSASGRAGLYGGLPLDGYMKASDADVSIWCQIEDAEAIRNIEEICATPEVDVLFVGRADLMQSLGASRLDDPSVERAVARVAEVAQATGKRLAIFLGDTSEVTKWKSLGFSILVCGSDQSMLRSATRSIKMVADEG
ncbi:MAG: aldolase/citrate lyase family protein [Rhizobiaceae bacterium]|nr:aldolase/citrate lyase family protein [Rhizobiaceae bacterium]